MNGEGWADESLSPYKCFSGPLPTILMCMSHKAIWNISSVGSESMSDSCLCAPQSPADLSTKAD